MADKHWAKQLQTWVDDGTFERMDDAIRSDRTVKIPRSDGSVSDGRITGFGFGGRSVSVRFQTPEGERFKTIAIDDFLELNPTFGPYLKEAIP
ncbi:MAG: hypothetical protein GY926_19440 [bacterium]|nr:hypothetical protein [bacterium]